MKISREKAHRHMFLRTSKSGTIRFTVAKHTLGKPEFWVCAKIASGSTTTGKRHSMCAAGKTPRKALAASLRKLAKATGGRRGAFRGTKAW